MRKFYTILAAALLCFNAGAFAQDFDDTFQFATADGKVIANGSTIIANVFDAEEAELMEEVEIQGGIFLKNTSEVAEKPELEVKVEGLAENVSLSCCLGSQCRMYEADGVNTIEADKNYAKVFAGGSLNDAMLHATAPLGNYFNFKAILTVRNAGGLETIDCSTITVNFVYADPANVKDMNQKQTVVKSFDVMGRESNGKGIMIQKMSDGSVRKVLK